MKKRMKRLMCILMSAGLIFTTDLSVVWASEASAGSAVEGSADQDDADKAEDETSEEKEYTISYHANGGSGSVSSVEGNVGKSIKLAAGGFSNSGKKLTGWNTEADGSGRTYGLGASYKSESGEDVTFYAMWEKAEAEEEDSEDEKSAKKAGSDSSNQEADGADEDESKKDKPEDEDKSKKDKPEDEDKSKKDKPEDEDESKKDQSGAKDEESENDQSKEEDKTEKSEKDSSDGDDADDTVQKPQVTMVSEDGTYTVGTHVELKVSASNDGKGTLTYQWYQNSSDSTSGGMVISGAVNAAYTVSADKEGKTYYYCVVTNTNENGKTASVTSETVCVTIEAEEPEEPEVKDAQKPVIETQPKGGTYLVGQKASLSIKASVTDGGTLTYQWYAVRMNTRMGAEPIEGATKAEYTPSTDVEGVTYYYCEVTNTNEKATENKVAVTESKIAEILVNSEEPEPVVDAETPKIDRISGGGTYTVDEAAPMEVTASVTDGGTLSYQWYKNSENSYDGAAAIAGATTAAYTAPTKAEGTSYYFCRVTNTNNDVSGDATASVDTKLITVTVKEASNPDPEPEKKNAETPKVSTPTGGGTYYIGESVTLKVNASVSDGGTLSYQWYFRDVNDNNQLYIIKNQTATTPTLKTAPEKAGTRNYFCRVTNTNKNATGEKTAVTDSKMVQVVLKVKNTGSNNNNNQNPNNNDNPNNNTGTTKKNAATPTVSGPTGATYSLNETASPLRVTASVSDGGTLSYQWYYNTSGSTKSGVRITGANSSTYQPVTSSYGTRYYFCLVTNTNRNATGSKVAYAVSQAAKVVVQTGSGSGSYGSGSTSLTSGTGRTTSADAASPTVTSPTGATYYQNETADYLRVTANASDGGTLTYQWYYNTQDDNTKGVVIKGANSSTYRPDTSTVGTRYYFCMVTNTNRNVSGKQVAYGVSRTARIVVQSGSRTGSYQSGSGSTSSTDVKTGDENPIFLWATLTGIAAAAAVVLIVRRRRRG